MKVKLKPESIKYIVLAVALIVILIVVLITTRQEGSPVERQVEEVPITRIVREAPSKSLVLVSSNTNKQMIVQNDPNLSDEEIKEQLKLSDEEFADMQIIIPASLTGRQMTQEQIDFQDELYRMYIEYLKDPGYSD